MVTPLRIVITVRGRLSDRLVAGFDGLTPVHHAGTTRLVGEVADQAQLHGLLARIRDLGLDLEAVAVSDACRAGDPPAPALATEADAPGPPRAR